MKTNNWDPSMGDFINKEMHEEHKIFKNKERRQFIFSLTLSTLSILLIITSLVYFAN